MPIFNRKNSEASRNEVSQWDPGTYAGRLRHIGRMLDDTRVRSIAIVEVSGSYIVRAIEQKSGDMMFREIVQEDFEHGANRKSRTLLPDSYEALLPEIGKDLDKRQAANVAIIELTQEFHMVGWVHGTSAGRSTYVAIDRDYPRTMLQSNTKPGR